MEPPFNWFDLVQKGGSVAAPLLMGALIWLNAERNRLLRSNESKDQQILELTKETITIAANSNATTSNVNATMNSMLTIMTSPAARK